MESDCCGAYTDMPEYGLCPECMEHCEFIEEEDDLIRFNCTFDALLKESEGTIQTINKSHLINN